MNTVKTVETGLLQAQNLSQSISVTGNIEARDKEEIILSTQQKVKKVHVSEGQEVKKNDVILSVDTTDLEYQLNKYKLNLELANRSLDSLLKKGSKSDKKSLENSVKQANINLSNATANYDEAKKKLEQNRPLYDIGAISKDEYDSSEKKMHDLKNQMELSQIQLSNAQDNNIIAIYDLSLYKVSVEVSQYDAVSISKGQKASIKVKGLDKVYTGTVSKIDEAAVIKLEGANKEIKVEIEITLDNSDEKVKVGYEADFDMQILEGLKAGDRYIKNPTEGLKDGDPVKESEVIK